MTTPEPTTTSAERHLTRAAETDDAGGSRHAAHHDFIPDHEGEVMMRRRLIPEETDANAVDVTARVNAAPDLIPPGQHEWLYGALYRVTDPGAREHLLDHENLVSVHGPICGVCERRWTPTVSRQPCQPTPTEEP